MGSPFETPIRLNDFDEFFMSITCIALKRMIAEAVILPVDHYICCLHMEIENSIWIPSLNIQKIHYFHGYADIYIYGCPHNGVELMSDSNRISISILSHYIWKQTLESFVLQWIKLFAWMIIQVFFSWGKIINSIRKNATMSINHSICGWNVENLPGSLEKLQKKQHLFLQCS